MCFNLIETKSLYFLRDDYLIEKKRTMNKESLEKMSRMRLLGMHHAFKTSIEIEDPQQFTNDE